MTVLLVSPDYLSHYLPLSALGSSLRRRGYEVAVATGPGLRDRVRDDGFSHVELVLGAGRNTGHPRLEDQTDGARESLAGFLAATEGGMIATLEYQARKRLDDLLWEPELVTDRLRAIVRDLEPSIVVSDQLAFGAGLALRALGIPFASFLPGHPCQLPPAGQPFGYPSRHPAEFAPERHELEQLRRLCADAALTFTDRFNAALASLAPHATPVADALAAGSPWLTLVNYPPQLVRRRRFPPATVLIGSCVRNDADREFDDLQRRTRPRAYVAFGTFLSARSDVLGRITSALRALGWDAVIAAGLTRPEELGPLPRRWVVHPFLPQVPALRACDVAVCHGGNNTVTEALTAGLPLLVAPFSTDQFAGAADLTAAGMGASIDPNRCAPAEIARRLERLLADGSSARTAALGRRLRRTPGAELAADLLERSFLSTRRPGRDRRSRSRGLAWN